MVNNSIESRPTGDVFIVMSRDHRIVRLFTYFVFILNFNWLLLYPSSHFNNKTIDGVRDTNSV